MAKATHKKSSPPSPKKTSRPSPRALAAALQRDPTSIHHDVIGPLQVLSVERAPDGGAVCEVSGMRLVTLGAEETNLRDVFVSVPVTARVSLAPSGAVAGADVPEPSLEMLREARAWARNLLANGQVRGVASSAPTFGPRGRPTHELVSDSQGRRVIRRLGFDAA